MGEPDKECRCSPSSLPADLQAFPRTASHQSRKTRVSLENKGKAGKRRGKYVFICLVSGLPAKVSKKCHCHCEGKHTALPSWLLSLEGENRHVS